MSITKEYVKQVNVKHLSDETDQVPKGRESDLALYEAEAKKTVNAGSGKLVPFHAIDVVNVRDVKSCDYMDAPVIHGDMSEIDVTAGDEFDPMTGVSATDDNGDVIPVTMEVKEA